MIELFSGVLIFLLAQASDIDRWVAELGATDIEARETAGR
jgi:hypothetical protein